MEMTISNLKPTAPVEIRGNKLSVWLLRFLRIFVIVLGVMILIPDLNPVRILKEINGNASLFTTSISYEALTQKFPAMVWKRNVLSPDTFYSLMSASSTILISVLVACISACVSLGNNLMKRISLVLTMVASVCIFISLSRIMDCRDVFLAAVEKTPSAAKYVTVLLPKIRLIAYTVVTGMIGVLSLGAFLSLPWKVERRFGMDERFRLFLMFLPVLVLTFIFSYLPVYGWRYAFFDYQAGMDLSMDNFMGWEYFKQLFGNEAYRDDLFRVLRNTLVMSGLGIATSWLPIAFAILLAELRYTKLQRAVQTLTTIPNFISWVLVYSIALAVFSTEGFINSLGRSIAGDSYVATNYLMGSDGIWIKMLLWGTWKGLGWSAIVYIAGIAGIDQQLYEAARVDGANRWQCIRHITVPGLMPTYMVMLLMSVAGILSNGMEQYLVFENPTNQRVIEVLDLYVYHGIENSFEMSTIMGMFKSVIGVALLFGANGISKAVRGESIV